jgi:predicted lipoprotein with Yx(FWY)xxD motif
MRVILHIVLAGVLVLSGCGDDEDDSGASQAPPPETTATQPEPQAGEPEPTGTEITLRDSEFGPMLFDSRKQAIYIFEKDPKGETVCYDECAEAWPPVYTEGEPRAAKGVKQSLLGTVKRRDGKLQVTYAGKPLYFYDHEGPGEVRCHNVDLNGGLWWVVGADGKRRP